MGSGGQRRDKDKQKNGETDKEVVEEEEKKRKH